MLKERDRYHHGDLRAALVEAAETVLTETGIEAFSLRQVAKRVGVSHSAPAHHFGDAQGLLSALAAEGFQRFLAAMQARQSKAEDESRAQLVAAGLGCFDFAEGSPALFQLMFARERTKGETAELAQAGEAAYRHLADGIERLRGVSPLEDTSAMADAIALWSMAQGVAELFISGRLKSLLQMSKTEREELLKGILLRAVA